MSTPENIQLPPFRHQAISDDVHYVASRPTIMRAPMVRPDPAGLFRPSMYSSPEVPDKIWTRVSSEATEDALRIGFEALDDSTFDRPMLYYQSIYSRQDMGDTPGEYNRIELVVHAGGRAALHGSRVLPPGQVGDPLQTTSEEITGVTDYQMQEFSSALSFAVVNKQANSAR